MEEKPKTFDTFVQGGVRYLAIPADGGVYIIDEQGNAYGAWFNVGNFKRATPRETYGKAELSIRHLS